MVGMLIRLRVPEHPEIENQAPVSPLVAKVHARERCRSGATRGLRK
jgi:hypothetical protein